MDQGDQRLTDAAKVNDNERGELRRTCHWFTRGDREGGEERGWVDNRRVVYNKNETLLEKNE